MEVGSDKQNRRRLVLPIVRVVEEGAGKDGVAEDEAARDQRDRREDDDDVVAKTESPFERRHERIARGGVRTVILILDWTMHHADTSDASFNRLAAVAVFAP